MRGRPLAGLGEVTDATRAVLCQGDEGLVDLVTRDVVVGERLGEVPDDAPSTPLDTDLRATARRLRLALDPAPRELVLDLRKDTDRARSHLLQPPAAARDPLGDGAARRRDRDLQGGLEPGVGPRPVGLRRRGQPLGHDRRGGRRRPRARPRP